MFISESRLILNVNSSFLHLTFFPILYQDDRQLSTNIHQRLERHWLGSIEIPFSTIYFNSKVNKANRDPFTLRTLTVVAMAQERLHRIRIKFMGSLIRFI